jgi:hypothetical protein
MSASEIACRNDTDTTMRADIHMPMQRHYLSIFVAVLRALGWWLLTCSGQENPFDTVANCIELRTVDAAQHIQAEPKLFTAANMLFTINWEVLLCGLFYMVGEK